MKNKIVFVFVIGLFLGNQLLFGMESLGEEVTRVVEEEALCRSQEAFESMVIGGVFVNEVLMFLKKDDYILNFRVINKAIDQRIREYYRDHEDQRIKLIYLTPEKFENERLLQQGLRFASEYFQGIRVRCHGMVFKKLLLDDDLDLIKPNLVGVCTNFYRLKADNDYWLELSLESEQLEKIKHLTEIILDFESCPAVLDTGLQKIANILSGLRKLKNVQLMLDGLHNVTNKGLGFISESLSRNDPFQLLIFSLSDLGRAGADCLRVVFPVIENAAKIMFRFGECNRTYHGDAIEIIAKFFKPNKCLQEVRFDLYHPSGEISDDELLPIVRALEGQWGFHIKKRSKFCIEACRDPSV